MASDPIALSIERIRACLGAQLPRELHGPEVLRRAAVAAILRPGAQSQSPEVLLIRRAEHPGDPWSGHMAFPGGRHDPEDPDLLTTAIRETREEVGLDLTRDAFLLGSLDDLPAVARAKRTGLIIRPYVFALTLENPTLTPDPHEVAETLWTPLAPLLEGKHSAPFEYQHEGRTIALPSFRLERHVVWGLTHAMLTMLFERLR